MCRRASARSLARAKLAAAFSVELYADFLFLFYYVLLKFLWIVIFRILIHNVEWSKDHASLAVSYIAPYKQKSFHYVLKCIRWELSECLDLERDLLSVPCKQGHHVPWHQIQTNLTLTTFARVSRTHYSSYIISLETQQIKGSPMKRVFGSGVRWSQRSIPRAKQRTLKWWLEKKTVLFWGFHTGQARAGCEVKNLSQRWNQYCEIGA